MSEIMTRLRANEHDTAVMQSRRKRWQHGLSVSDYFRNERIAKNHKIEITVKVRRFYKGRV